MFAGIDPGTYESALVVWDQSHRRVVRADIFPNHELLDGLRSDAWGDCLMACEMIASYGMPVGKETFETVLWIGRFMEARNPGQFELVYRKDIKMHFCYSMQAKDANVAQALRDRFGAKGNKANPGPLYGIKSHLWQALAVATYWTDKYREQLSKQAA